MPAHIAAMAPRTEPADRGTVFATVLLAVATALCIADATAADICATDSDGEKTACFEAATLLEEEATTSANASIGDLDNDGHLDVVLIKGRHWPVVDRVLLGDGTGEFPRSADLGKAEDRSYTGALADIDGDGDLDIVVSNDRPDDKLVYLNDGAAGFSVKSTFGEGDWATRNISLADLNNDELPDIVVANRGPRDGGASPNYICLNEGEGRFADTCLPFSNESATTITPADMNGDGLTDLVVPHRDGGQSHVYIRRQIAGLRFSAHPFGPEQISIRATAVADFDDDGHLDIVAIHTGNSEGGDGVRAGRANLRGTFIYYGLGETRFSDAIPISDPERAPYALSVADLDADGAMDILVGHVEAATTLFMNRSGRRFGPVDLGDTDGVTYGFAVGDLNEDSMPDIVLAKSGAVNRAYFSRPDRAH